MSTSDAPAGPKPRKRSKWKGAAQVIVDRQRLDAAEAQLEELLGVSRFQPIPLRLGEQRHDPFQRRQADG